MEIHRLVAAKVAYTDGIEMARYRLIKVSLAGTESLLDGTVAATTLVVAGKDAVLGC